MSERWRQGKEDEQEGLLLLKESQKKAKERGMKGEEKGWEDEESEWTGKKTAENSCMTETTNQSPEQSRAGQISQQLGGAAEWSNKEIWQDN